MHSCSVGAGGLRTDAQSKAAEQGGLVPCQAVPSAQRALREDAPEANLLHQGMEYGAHRSRMEPQAAAESHAPLADGAAWREEEPAWSSALARAEGNPALPAATRGPGRRLGLQPVQRGYASGGIAASLR